MSRDLSKGIFKSNKEQKILIHDKSDHRVSKFVKLFYFALLCEGFSVHKISLILLSGANMVIPPFKTQAYASITFFIPSKPAVKLRTYALFPLPSKKHTFRRLPCINRLVPVIDIACFHVFKY
jgi:uncharacterized membrane protein